MSVYIKFKLNNKEYTSEQSNWWVFYEEIKTRLEEVWRVFEKLSITLINLFPHVLKPHAFNSHAKSTVSCALFWMNKNIVV